MAITLGFTCTLADVVVVDTFFDSIQTGSSGSSSPFQTDSNQNVVSSYIIVSNTGDIVYENQNGNPQFISGVPEGLIPISATRILSAATVRGNPRTTTATILSWMGDFKY